MLIYDDNSKKLLNVTYSEYIPSRLGGDTPITKAPSDIYIAPDATRSITAINVKNGNVFLYRL